MHQCARTLTQFTCPPPSPSRAVIQPELSQLCQSRQRQQARFADVVAVGQVEVGEGRGAAGQRKQRCRAGGG